MSPGWALGSQGQPGMAPCIPHQLVSSQVLDGQRPGQHVHVCVPTCAFRCPALETGVGTCLLPRLGLGLQSPLQSCSPFCISALKRSREANGTSTPTGGQGKQRLATWEPHPQKVCTQHTAACIWKQTHSSCSLPELGKSFSEQLQQAFHLKGKSSSHLCNSHHCAHASELSFLRFQSLLESYLVQLCFGLWIHVYFFVSRKGKTTMRCN